jgi:hypothetical protein
MYRMHPDIVKKLFSEVLLSRYDSDPDRFYVSTNDIQDLHEFGLGGVEDLLSMEMIEEIEIEKEDAMRISVSNKALFRTNHVKHVIQEKVIDIYYGSPFRFPAKEAQRILDEILTDAYSYGSIRKALDIIREEVSLVVERADLYDSPILCSGNQKIWASSSNIISSRRGFLYHKVRRENLEKVIGKYSVFYEDTDFTFRQITDMIMKDPRISTSDTITILENIYAMPSRVLNIFSLMEHLNSAYGFDFKTHEMERKLTRGGAVEPDEDMLGALEKERYMQEPVDKVELFNKSGFRPNDVIHLTRLTDDEGFIAGYLKERTSSRREITLYLTGSRINTDLPIAGSIVDRFKLGLLQTLYPGKLDGMNDLGAAVTYLNATYNIGLIL